MWKTMFRGFSTGMLLVVNTAIQNGLAKGFAAVVGVTVGDFIYITLAILGIGKLLERQKIKRIFAALSALVLIAFGIAMIQKGLAWSGIKDLDVLNGGVVRNFVFALMLTISSPLTIIFWTSIFATKSIEYSLTKRELVVFGLSAGASTLVFLGMCIIGLSLVKTMIPSWIIQWLNIVVGAFLIYYGMVRAYKEFKKPQISSIEGNL